MNSTTTTGAIAVTSTMLAGVIIWLCGIVNVTPPPVEVAGTISAVLLYGAHCLANLVDRRWPPPPALPAPVPPAPQS